MSLRSRFLGCLLGAGHLAVALIPDDQTRFFLACLIAIAIIVLAPIAARHGWKIAQRNTVHTLINSAPIIDRVLNDIDT